jgi:hypothetical protein
MLNEVDYGNGNEREHGLSGATDYFFFGLLGGGLVDGMEFVRASRANNGRMSHSIQ